MTLLKLVTGDSIYYEQIDGDAARPTLVFLHEALGCSRLWKSFPARLCRKTGCPGLLYDRAGFGQSSPKTGGRTINYLHEQTLNELSGVIQGLLCGRPFILVGHSDGATITLMYGSERPRDLKGIISEAAHVFVEPETIEGIRLTVERYERGELKGLSKYHGEKTDWVFRSWADTWTSDWFRSWNIEYLLPSIDVPLLVIQGRDDQFATVAQVDSIVSHTSAKTSSMLIDDCGHIPHLEQSELMLQLMAEFIEKLL